MTRGAFQGSTGLGLVPWRERRAGDAVGTRRATVRESAGAARPVCRLRTGAGIPPSALLDRITAAYSGDPGDTRPCL